MSSTILYKFRSGTTFEALPLPGTAARLFDVKRAIVKARKLDANAQLEFDLSVRDATTNEEYVDETMLLPRGTRVVVQRLPAARGHGFLARMARAESGAAPAATGITTTVAPSGFYTIDGRARDDEDEFVQTNDEEKELAALMAVTDPGTASTSGFRPNLSARVAGSGVPRPGAGHVHKQPNFRPNADPELRDQERMPKKRATGIPRTFLNLSAPPVTDGGVGDSEEAVARLQPNAIGFEELVNRGGGQSENTTGTKRDLDYALKLTATTIPEHLQCGICHGVVRNAMLLPWDMEGRTACESCIRDALTQSGFRCPLTGTEGVSPDDLLPNYSLRKAADLFVKGVMEKMDEIDREQVDEPEDEFDASAVGASLEGESGDKGVIVSRKTMKDHKSRRNDDDPFGGDDDFGGDVFDVAPDEADEDEMDDKADDADEGKPEGGTLGSEAPVDSADAKEKDETEKTAETNKNENLSEISGKDENRKMNKSNQSEKDSPSQNQSPAPRSERDGASPHAPSQSTESRRDARKRGPPAGYAVGPAGGSAVVRAHGGDKRSEGAYSSPPGRSGSPHGGRGRGYGGGRGDAGRGGRQGRFYDSGGRNEPDYMGRGGRGGYQQPRYDNRSHQEEVEEDDDAHSRGTKRSRSESEDFSRDDRYGGRGGRGWSGRGRYNDRAPYGGRFDNRGRGPPPGHYRGGRGGRGPPFRGGRGGYGRGRY